MKKIYTAVLICFLLIISIFSQAQSFSWSNYTAGANSYNASNMGVTMSSNGNGTGSISGFPSYSSSSGGYLNIGADWSNKTSNLKYTITFSKPLVGVTFLLYDVDQGSSWDDKLTIAGATEGNVAVNPVITASSYNTVSGNVIEGSADNATYLNNPAVVSFGSGAVKSITITYSAGSASPSNPAAQYVGIGNITFGTVLPVQLVSFSATKRNSNADLKWQAENMINFSRFEIERSATGTGNFETIGAVSTGGVESGTFTYTDMNVQNRMGRAFYRLKIVDVDGQFKYSPVMMISFGEPVIDVRPTVLAAGEPIRIQLAGNTATRYDVRLFDASGKLLQQQSQVNGQVQLGTSLLKKGIYILSVTDGIAPTTFRIAVQ